MAKALHLRAKRVSRVVAQTGERRGEAKRHAVLVGAKSVFLRHGFGGASMDGVAAAAGVSKMTVYRHFANKEALFAGLIGELCERMFDGGVSAGLEDLAPAEALRRFARGFARTVFDPETIGLHRIVIAESARFPDLGKLFYASGPERNIAALAAYLAEPRLKVDDPQRSAEEFLDIIRGYAHLRLLLGTDRAVDARALDRRIERAVAHVLA